MKPIYAGDAEKKSSASQPRQHCQLLKKTPCTVLRKGGSCAWVETLIHAEITVVSTAIRPEHHFLLDLGAIVNPSCVKHHVVQQGGDSKRHVALSRKDT